MEQAKQAIFDHLLSQEGVKPTNEDFKMLPKYYEFTIGNKSAFSGNASQMHLPQHLVDQAKQCGFWSVYLGDPEGCGRHRLIRNMLQNSYFREYLQYPQILGKVYRKEYINDMKSELGETQESIEGFYNEYKER